MLNEYLLLVDSWMTVASVSGQRLRWRDASGESRSRAPDP